MKNSTPNAVSSIPETIQLDENVTSTISIRKQVLSKTIMESHQDSITAVTISGLVSPESSRVP